MGVFTLYVCSLPVLFIFTVIVIVIVNVVAAAVSTPIVHGRPMMLSQNATPLVLGTPRTPSQSQSQSQQHLSTPMSARSPASSVASTVRGDVGRGARHVVFGVPPRLRFADADREERSVGTQYNEILFVGTICVYFFVFSGQQMIILTHKITAKHIPGYQEIRRYNQCAGIMPPT
jgi:hypothetical protein